MSGESTPGDKMYGLNTYGVKMFGDWGGRAAAGGYHSIQINS
jgi:hypothetical protein